METLGKARRVRIYIDEDDRRAGKLLYRAVVELLRAESAQGATVFRALEGFGAAGRAQFVAFRLVPAAARVLGSPEAARYSLSLEGDGREQSGTASLIGGFP